MTNTQLIAKTLKYCNAMRAKFGREPVDRLRKGLQRNANECPIARTIENVTVSRIAVMPDDRLTTYRLPPSAEEFRSKFDHGGIPELIDHGTELTKH